jgi:Sulfotransferase domain
MNFSGVILDGIVKMPATTDTPTPFLEKLYRAGTSPLRLLPDFLIIGTQRGGTTSLYNYLADHPCIGAASIKEVHFFDSAHFKQGPIWYRGHFPSLWQKYAVEREQKQKFITGESSPYYLFHPHTAKRVAALLSQIKLIVMLRNPVDRAYSHYYHEIAGGHEKLTSFEEAIEREEKRLRGEQEKMLTNENYTSYNHRHYSYLARGKYIEQLQTWLSLFAKEQVLILKSEDFYRDPAGVYKQTLRFLDVPDVAFTGEKQEFKTHNETKPPKMNTETRKRLMDYFAPYNERLYSYLDINFGWI